MILFWKIVYWGRGDIHTYGCHALRYWNRLLENSDRHSWKKKEKLLVIAYVFLLKERKKPLEKIVKKWWKAREKKEILRKIAKLLPLSYSTGCPMSKCLFWKGCMKDVPDFHHKIWIFLLSEIHPYFVNSMFPILWNWLFFSIKIWLVNSTCQPLDFYNIKESLLSLIKLPLFFSNTCRRSFVWRKKTPFHLVSIVIIKMYT